MEKILQLKISLDEIKPKIWRQFLVPDNINFNDLHNIIQIVMGWENYHLWEFKIGNTTITPPDEEGYNLAEAAINKLMKSAEFRKMVEEQDLSKGTSLLNINKANKILKKLENEEKEKNSFSIEAPINKLFNKEGIKFSYRYDFGDNWEHSLTVEKLLDMDESQTYPICIAGERACPPEDCGSVPGYYESMKIRLDKKHPEYKERIIDWLGEDYNPEHFDINKINKELKKFIKIK